VSVFILAPKNSGLKKYKKIALSNMKNVDSSKIITARGEDIPLLLQQYLSKGRKAIGLTGEDLFLDFSVSKKGKKINILKTIEWKDSLAMFSKPTLCLLGSNKVNLINLPKDLTIYISSKYKNIANKYLKKFEKNGFRFNKIYITGCVETNIVQGLADLVIDIVYTGGSIKESNLQILEKIMESNFVIIGKKNEVPYIKKSITQLKPYTPPLENRIDKLGFDFNENTLGPSQKVMKILKNTPAKIISSYPEYNKLMVKIAEYCKVKPENIIATNGSDEGIQLAIDCTLEKDGEIIIIQPTFQLYDFYSQKTNGQIKKINFEKDFSFPIKKLMKIINEKTRIVILCNPNNPTGKKIPKKYILKILEKLKNGIVLVDEAYYEYSKETAINLIKDYENLLITRTFSKAFGLAGLRIGYLLGNENLIKILNKAKSPYNVNYIAVNAAIAAIDDSNYVNEYVEQIEKSKKILYKYLENQKIEFIKSDTNFVLIKFGDQKESVFEGLKNTNILVRDVSKQPMLNGFLRVNVGTVEQTNLFVKELDKIISKTILIFDIDGVLIDVNNSYRKAIQETVKFFSGKEIADSEIQEIRNKKILNNDWEITQRILEKYNKIIPIKKVVEKFQEFYLGKNFEGFIKNEKLLINKNILKNIYKKYELAIFTGRPKKEANFILDYFKIKEFFSTLICMEDCTKGKPNPEGLEKIISPSVFKKAIYFGDSVADLESAKNAKIESVGVMSNQKYSVETQVALKKAGAKAILNSINEIEEVLK